MVGTERLPEPKPEPLRARREPPTLRRLLPPGEAASAQEIVEQLQLSARIPAEEHRPYVLLNMISTADGRASIDGRSGPLGGEADRALFHALRLAADGVMAGAGTVRTERYGRIIPEQARRRAREERGLAAEPLACIVSARLALPADLPLIATPEARVAIITASSASLPDSAAHIEYVRTARDGLVDLPAALAELRGRFGVRALLCEGGPHLNWNLLAAGVVDELYLTLSAKLAGGDPPEGEALRILAGGALDAPIELRLLSVLESDSQLFLRYGVGARTGEPLSRDTARSSSLAR